jgi:quercetin dioxygenase-like cupin family protein
MGLKIERWKKEWGELSEAAMRRRLEIEGYTVARYAYAPGTLFANHTHSFDKKDALVSGRFLIRALGQEFTLGPGDAIEVPAGTVHSAEVLGDETVISLDASRY